MTDTAKQIQETMREKGNPDAADSLLRFSCFDPLIGFARDKNDIETYDIWPQGLRLRKANFIVMALGGSTSTWPRCEWSKNLIPHLKNLYGATLVFNGGMSGYGSSQEMLKLLRDAPAVNPNLIVSLSGVNDFGFLHARATTPLIHRYYNSVATHLVEGTGAFERASFGLSYKIEPWQHWLRNTRMMRLMAEELGSTYVTFLQPTLVRGHVTPGAGEQRMLAAPEVKRSLSRVPRNYEEEVHYFYDKVQEAIAAEPEKYSHIIDISDVFEGESGVYRDYRHQNTRGNKLIAKRMFDEMLAKGVIVDERSSQTA